LKVIRKIPSLALYDTPNTRELSNKEDELRNKILPREEAKKIPRTNS
jgi:hypothetical protein